MADEIKLKIGGDTSGLEKAFEKAVGAMKSQAASIRVASTTPGVEAFRNANQVTNQASQKIREEKAGLEITNVLIERRKRLLDDISKAQANSVKGQKDELDLLNKRLKAEEQLANFKRLATVQQANIARAEAAQVKLYNNGVNPANFGGSGQDNKPGPAPTDLKGILGALGVPLGALAAMYTGVKAGSALEGIRSSYAESGYRATEIGAKAFNQQGAAGQRLSSLIGGNGLDEYIFNPERQQASEAANDQMKKRLESSFRLFTRPFQTIFGRANNGYETGNQFGLGSEGQKNKVDAEQELERNQLQAEQLEALKNGPGGRMKSLLGQRYSQNYQRDLDFQRQMGLDNAGFRGSMVGPTRNASGGFIQDVTNAGFTDVQGMGMASGIMGAGGSTRASSGLAAFGLQAQRGLDMTNAASVIGKLSNSMGGADTTKEAFVKILAEGTRVGLDGSQFREENRKFVETAASIISASGTTSGAGVDQLLSQVGRFFGDKTGAGLEAGKGAYDLYRQTSMATSGPRGTMRAAGMLSDPTIMKLGRDSREALFNMPIDQLTADNPAIIAMAKEAGVTPDQLIQAQNKVTSSSANQFVRSDKARDNLAALKKKYGASSAIAFMANPSSQSAYDEMSVALGQSNIAQIKEHPELGQNQRMASAYSDALASGDVQGSNKALEDAKKAQIAGGGRPEDETNRIQAETSKLANQLFMDIKDSIMPASTAAAQFAKDINSVRAAMQGATPSKAAQLWDSFAAGHGLPTNMPSAGPASSGGGSGN